MRRILDYLSSRLDDPIIYLYEYGTLILVLAIFSSFTCTQSCPCVL